MRARVEQSASFLVQHVNPAATYGVSGVDCAAGTKEEGGIFAALPCVLILTGTV